MSHISGKLGLLLASHNLNNSGDLVSRAQLLKRPIKSLIFVASIMRRILCPKMSYTYSTVDMSDERGGQSMHTSLFGKVCRF